MRGSTILLSYANGSRGLLITPAHPTYEGFYYTVIICQRVAEDSYSPLSTPPLYEGFYYTVIICQGEQRIINHQSPPPPPYEGFYYIVIICQGDQRTINHPSPTSFPGFRVRSISMMGNCCESTEQNNMALGVRWMAVYAVLSALQGEYFCFPDGLHTFLSLINGVAVLSCFFRCLSTVLQYADCEWLSGVFTI